MNKLECSLEDHFNRQAVKYGFYSLKLKALSRRGFPDRTLLGAGQHIFFVELKREDGKEPKPKRHQVWWHRLLRRLGFRVYVINTRKQVKKTFEHERSLAGS